MGATSVFFYIIVYSLTNLGAFGVVAALSSRAGGDELQDFDGMAKRAPFLSSLMLIFVLSLAGFRRWRIPGQVSTFLRLQSNVTPELRPIVAVVLGILMSAFRFTITSYCSAHLCG